MSKKNRVKKNGVKKNGIKKNGVEERRQSAFPVTSSQSLMLRKKSGRISAPGSFPSSR